MTGADLRRAALRKGRLEVIGRIRSASNATFLCEARLSDDPGEEPVQCVYKPVAGEQPLWDFPDGTLAGREVSAYLISEALGWNVVPYTVIRKGPAGPGMLQLWVDQPEESEGIGLVDLRPVGAVPPGYLSVLTAYDYTGTQVALVHADDPRLRRMAVFDVIVNNADRKGGHVLDGVDGVVYGVDHGIALHVHDKLRTVLWGWAGQPIDDETLGALDRLVQQLDSVSGSTRSSAPGSTLGKQLRKNLTPAEVDALRRRVRGLLDAPVMPVPNGRRPLPWPAF